ncbi:hypothetical protein ID866_1396 [Astraeus odoratus]|nr:hypothetical protein ID866_1396 [Astraeus odoratus]
MLFIAARGPVVQVDEYGGKIYEGSYLNPYYIIQKYQAFKLLSGFNSTSKSFFNSKAARYPHPWFLFSVTVSCGDVVKKPKLDSHYGYCHSPFDCIDCSTTFHTPAEFKGHTSCITEAEKYQKTENIDYTWKRNQNRNGGGANGKSNGAANEPCKTSSQSQSNRTKDTVTESTAAPPEPIKPSSNPPDPDILSPEKSKKDKKHKEKKSKSKDAAAKNEVNGTEATAVSVDPPPAPVPQSPEKLEATAQEPKEKSKKKKRKEQSEDGTKIKGPNVGANADGGTKKEKKKKVKKETAPPPGDSAVASIERGRTDKEAKCESEIHPVELRDGQKDKKAKKSKGKVATEETGRSDVSTALVADGEDVDNGVKEKSKKRKHQDVVADSDKVAVQSKSEGEEGKKKKGRKDGPSASAILGEPDETRQTAIEEDKASAGDVEPLTDAHDKKRKREDATEMKEKKKRKHKKEKEGQRTSSYRQYHTEEFVAAGDFLTYKFPVWQWERGDASKGRDYLPADKQYLVTRGVPCLRRAQSLAYTDADEDAERLLSFGDSSSGLADEWVETHAGRKSTVDSAANPGEIDDIPDLDGDHDHELANAMGNVSISSTAGATAGETPDLDDIPDMEEDDLEADDDEATAAPKAGVPSSGGVIDASQVDPAKGNLLQVRTYDVMITYDKYYQTPRIWLIGYDENRNPLTPAQIFQDVSADHALKTVTIEAFPHSLTLQAASVHPCKHASVMKKVIERMNAGVEEQLAARKKEGSSKDSSSSNSKKKWVFGRKNSKDDSKDKPATNDEEEQPEVMRVDFYLVVFLKFIASIVPTIEVDSTTAF